MLFRFRAHTARAFFPFAAIVACVARAQAPPAQPAAELSTIVVPIRMNLAKLSPELEKNVPTKFADTTTERGIDVRYDVARDPIRLQMIGAGLHATTKVSYALEACRGRFPCISCGFGEPRRVAEIHLQSKLDWDPAWRLRSSTRLLPVHYARPCEVTWLDVDITKRFVAPVVDQQLNLAARIIDKNTPALTNLRPDAEQIWTSLQTPTELAERTWLVLEPADVALTPISGSGQIVTSTLTLRAQTRVIVGNKPATARKPLPPLKVANATPGGVRVPLDLQLPYDEASRLASNEFAKKTYTVNGKPLTIESLRIAPAPNGKLLVEAQIDYRGGVLRNYRGALFLEGTPRFDPATSRIVVPDLEYSLDPKRRGFFARIAERAAHQSIRQRMRESAQFDLGARIATVRAEVTRALNRDLARGVKLKGRADAVTATTVTPQPDTITIHVIASGIAEVEL